MCVAQKKGRFLFLLVHPLLLASAAKFGRKGLVNPGATLRGVQVTPGSLGSSTMSKKSWGSSMFSMEWSSWYSPIRKYGLEESEKRSEKQVALAIANMAFHSTVLDAPEPGVGVNLHPNAPSTLSVDVQAGNHGGWHGPKQTKKQISGIPTFIKSNPTYWKIDGLHQQPQSLFCVHRKTRYGLRHYQNIGNRSSHLHKLAPGLESKRSREENSEFELSHVFIPDVGPMGGATVIVVSPVLNRTRNRE